MTEDRALHPLTQAARRALVLMDLTSLDPSDGEDTMTAMASAADTPFGTPAALCVWSHLVPTARTALLARGLTDIKIATVTNFPHGNRDADKAAREARDAVERGADEIDVVFPWASLLDGNEATGYAIVSQSKEAAGFHPLKVILETGELHDPALIRRASEISIAAGADFLKTSTGKVAINATPEAASVMLTAIRDSGKPIGFKASGGVRTTADAKLYLDLADSIMGQGWVSRDTFRFGASGLLSHLLATLGHKAGAASGHSY